MGTWVKEDIKQYDIKIFSSVDFVMKPLIELIHMLQIQQMFWFLYCYGVEWSKDRTQAAESIKWRPQQANSSRQVLLSQPQTVFSTHKILTLTH